MMGADSRKSVRQDQHQTKKPTSFWRWAITSIMFRLVLIYFSKHLNLSTRPEISTPVTSLRRLAEGYWLKQSSMSPYSGSMYHGSPLLLTVLGPLTVTRNGGLPSHILCSLLFVIADFLGALFIRASGRILESAYSQHLKLLGLGEKLKCSDLFSCGDIGALVYLWNPMTIVTCVGSSTAPIENLFIILSIYGACARMVPLAAFGWAMATHLSLYPVILVIPVILLLSYGLDGPPRKLVVPKFSGAERSSSGTVPKDVDFTNNLESYSFSWKSVVQFLVWASIWLLYIFVLCAISSKQSGGLMEMLRSTYGFILTVEDLSPNVGVIWYFFAEVFDFFRNFFLIVIHMNVLFMLLPLAVRLKHRPCFLAFVYVAISAMLKSYPSVADSALYLALLGLFANELADMEWSFLIFCGYMGVNLLSPVMHNLWMWRGTGNANFYYATSAAYFIFQVFLVAGSVSSVLNHDRKLRDLCAAQA